MHSGGDEGEEGGEMEEGEAVRESANKGRRGTRRGIDVKGRDGEGGGSEKSYG